MKVRHKDLMKKSHWLQNIDQTYRKTNVSSSSLFRMVGVYWGDTQVKSAESKRSINRNQSSIPNSVK